VALRSVLRRHRFTTGLIVGLTAAVLGSAGIATAAVSSGIISACVDHHGNLRVSNHCLNGEKSLSWNVAGVSGPQGPSGPAGAAGAQGPAGPQGPAGTASIGPKGLIGEARFINAPGIQPFLESARTSNGAVITERRYGAGAFYLTFPGFADGFQELAQISVEAPGQLCILGNVQESGVDYVADVQCKDLAGNPADQARFTITVTA
jgi:hypothetical protein